jgi:hypothetical protein
MIQRLVPYFVFLVLSSIAVAQIATVVPYEAPLILRTRKLKVKRERNREGKEGSKKIGTAA